MEKQVLGRLYLSKNDSIYVDYNLYLPQHQLDGIRFLFRQFQKKERGVILNDPSGYGKCVQAVLFLDAIQSVIPADKPVLVLCNEHSLNAWEEHFQKWTSITDVALQMKNPYKKYRVYINSISDAATFARRHWSVVIMHDNTFSKDRFRTDFNADFKIWISSVDMKENLQTFSLIYEWLHPNCKVNIEDFQVKSGNLRDVVYKSLLLDAFLEDIVLRRENFLMPFKSQNEIPKTPLIDESPKKVSRKNKDPTGLKVKKSKRRRIEDDDDAPLSRENEEIRVSNGDSNDLSVQPITKSNKTDVEEYIHENKPVNENLGFEEPNNSNHSADFIEFTESNTFNAFQNALNEVIENENIENYEAHNDEDAKVPNIVEKSITENEADFDKGCDSKVEVTIENSIENETAGKEDSQDFVITEKEPNNIKKEKTSENEESNIPNDTKKPPIVNETAQENDLKKSEDKNNVEHNSDDFLTEFEKNLLRKYKGSALDSFFN